MVLVEEKKKNWLDLLDTHLVDLYPLQFANIERLNNYENDAVYIFDEVGSGKTISSGIMALDYLKRNPKDKVLVITTNALAQSNSIKPYGQFIGDWFDKLPFGNEEIRERVHAINNHHSRFKNQESYGLVIIDEAHLFLNERSLRHQNLIQNIRAKKVVFLTATPIKQYNSDLEVYLRIAEVLLHKKVDESWIYQLQSYGKKPEELICSQFDVKSPVTRYFKDTIKSLHTEGYEKTRARRYETLTWEYDSFTNKNKVLAENIRALYDRNHNNRFVVFTRYVVKEADAIGDYLRSEGFDESREGLPNKPTFYIVTGRNPQELADFSKLTDLPTVLILTYQIAEQGVNLPGYNYVVNYHISAFPSALEQRYGRIDRLNSQSEAIYNCFLINTNDGEMDTSTFNFLLAVNTCLGSLWGHLPSRNTILSPKVLTDYTNLKKHYEKYIARITKFLQGDAIIALYENLVSNREQPNETSLYTMDNGLRDLYEFCFTSGISIDEKLLECEELRSEAKERLIEDIKEELENIKQIFSQGGDKEEQIIGLLSQGDGMWDNIFYSKEKVYEVSKDNIGHLNAAGECASFISNSDTYKEYLEKFKKQIQIPFEFKEHRAKVNRIFEEAFEDNDFNTIFPEIENSSYREQLENKGEFSQLILENLDQLIPTLPFFKMVSQFKANLRKLASINGGYDRLKFDGDKHAFAEAMEHLPVADFGLSEEFRNKYFGHVSSHEETSYTDSFQSFFEVSAVKELDENDINGRNVSKVGPSIDLPYPNIVKESDEGGGNEEVSEASPWLKLAYHLTRKESYCCILERSGFEGFILKGIYDVEKDSDIPKGDLDVTLFNYIIRINNGKYRTWAERHLVGTVPSAKYVWSDDYWTKGILETVRRQKFYEV